MQKRSKPKPLEHRNSRQNDNKATKDEEVAPARACKTNYANVSCLPKKTNEAIDKTIAENNTTEQLYI